MERHFVSRYKYSHTSRRKLFKKWKAKGFVKVVESNDQGWVYAVEDGYKVSKIIVRKNAQFSILQANN